MFSYKSLKFESHYELTRYLIEADIPPSDIIQITHSQIKYDYSPNDDCYTLFYIDR